MPRGLTDAQLLATLNAAPSVRMAARHLGISRPAMKNRCRQNPEMLAAYESCRERGQPRRGSPLRFRDDPAILAALNAAPSTNRAALALGMARSAMEKRCEFGELAIAFEACAARGRQRQGSRGRMTGAELDQLEREAAAQ